mgnify:CR=1 FL=1
MLKILIFGPQVLQIQNEIRKKLFFNVLKLEFAKIGIC